MSRKSDNGFSNTICWDCENAVPNKKGRGCSWSMSFEPVEGWDAERSDLNMQNRKQGDIESYIVKSCPLFKQG